jgi:hypothetical protein
VISVFMSYSTAYGHFRLTVDPPNVICMTFILQGFC